MPFTATEENLREHFEQFGKVTDVTLLKKPDGKLVGCGFIQFELVQKAAKARHHTNGKPFLGREIICDWALAKDKYEVNVEANKNKPEIKSEENDTVIKVEIKEEPQDTWEQHTANSSSESTIKLEQPKEEDVSDTETDKNTELSGSVLEKNDLENGDLDDNETEELANTDEQSEEEEEESEDTEDEFEDTENESKGIIKAEAKESIKRPHVISNDITEGKTVFIKNLPFSATNEDLKNCMSQFGPVYYALVCVDKFTEHSKGTAFVKFVVSALFFNIFLCLFYL